jgi:hypothetical protein
MVDGVEYAAMGISLDLVRPCFRPECRAQMMIYERHATAHYVMMNPQAHIDGVLRGILRKYEQISNDDLPDAHQFYNFVSSILWKLDVHRSDIDNNF